jgi:hypothetical protein
MVDPRYRTEPDPEFADRLEQVLLGRLTAEPVRHGLASGDAPRRTEAEHGDGHMIMLDAARGPTGPTAPRRRPPSTWLLVAAACAMVAAVGTLLVAAADDNEQVHTVTSTPTTTTIDETPAPDRVVTKSLDPDGDDATALRVTYEVPAAGWDGTWFGAVKYLEGDADGITGLSITTVTNLVGDACRDHTPLDPPVGPGVDDLATALSQLSPFVVTAPPTDVTMFGYRGKHLELTVPAIPVTGGGDASASKNVAEFTDCVEGELHSWISPINHHPGGGSISSGLLGHSMDSLGAFNAYQTPGQTEEFWILDVDGTRVVLIKLDTPLSPAADIAQRDAIFDSIRIEP